MPACCAEVADVRSTYLHRAMETLQALQAQLRDAKNYPQNMLLSGYPKYMVDLRYRQLNDQIPRLFCKEERARLDFLEFSQGGKGELTSAHKHSTHLGISPQLTICRFLGFSHFQYC